MEFWAAEVKNGEAFKVKPGEGMVLHLSQASIGEIKKEKGNESVCLFVNVDGKKLVLGTLFSDKLPQQQFDLVFDREFELSHNWKNGNTLLHIFSLDLIIFITEDDEGDFDSEDEDIPLTVANNGKPETKVKEEKPAEAKKANAEKDTAAGKQKVKIVEPNPDPKRDEDDDSSDEDGSMSDDDDVSTDEDEDASDSEQDDESEDSDEETPKKVETGKKRAADSALKTPGSDKKAKMTTPQKTDGKKGSGHVATPHPSKQAGKNKNQQTPKSGGGSHTCKTCNKGFGSESALESHTKAKHSTGK
ncbi:hypothetical protein ACH5RR_005564 [Cinchona calisaya]|uniref:C2H2-type domain-containing protein n=1 Tax=Cinchona calisaya TaxID=153742 RepID=A0ABD3ALK3_9GENT